MSSVINTPLESEVCSLEILLADVTEENIHREIDYGDAVGNEA